MDQPDQLCLPVLIISPSAFLSVEQKSDFLKENQQKIISNFTPLTKNTQSLSQKLQSVLGATFERNQTITSFLTLLPVATRGHIVRYLRYGSRITALASALLKYFFALVLFTDLCLRIKSTANISYDTICNALRLTSCECWELKKLQNDGESSPLSKTKNNKISFQNPTQPAFSLSQPSSIAPQSTPNTLCNQQHDVQPQSGLENATTAFAQNHTKHNHFLTIIDWTELKKNKAGKPFVVFNQTLMAMFARHLVQLTAQEPEKDHVLIHQPCEQHPANVPISDPILSTTLHHAIQTSSLFDINVTHDSGITMGTIGLGYHGVDSMCVDMNEYNVDNSTNYQSQSLSLDSSIPGFGKANGGSSQAIFDLMNYNPFTLSSSSPPPAPITPLPQQSNQFTPQSNPLLDLIDSCQLTFSPREHQLFLILLSHRQNSLQPTLSTHQTTSQSTLSALLAQIKEQITLHNLNIDDMINHHQSSLQSTPSSNKTIPNLHFNPPHDEIVTPEFILTLFYTYWTTKEAIVKAFGTGFWIPASSIDLCEYLILFIVRYWSGLISLLEENESAFGLSERNLKIIKNDVNSKKITNHHQTGTNCDSFTTVTHYRLTDISNVHISSPPHATTSLGTLMNENHIATKTQNDEAVLPHPLELILIHHSDCVSLRSILLQTLTSKFTHYNINSHSGSIDIDPKDPNLSQFSVFQNELRPIHHLTKPSPDPLISDDSIFTFLQSSIRQHHHNEFNQGLIQPDLSTEQQHFNELLPSTQSFHETKARRRSQIQPHNNSRLHITRMSLLQLFDLELPLLPVRKLDTETGPIPRRLRENGIGFSGSEVLRDQQKRPKSCSKFAPSLFHIKIATHLNPHGLTGLSSTQPTVSQNYSRDDSILAAKHAVLGSDGKKFGPGCDRGHFTVITLFSLSPTIIPQFEYSRLIEISPTELQRASHNTSFEHVVGDQKHPTSILNSNFNPFSGSALPPRPFCPLLRLRSYLGVLSKLLNQSFGPWNESQSATGKPIHFVQSTSSIEASPHPQIIQISPLQLANLLLQPIESVVEWVLGRGELVG